jgi:hypothetical protein
MLSYEISVNYLPSPENEVKLSWNTDGEIVFQFRKDICHIWARSYRAWLEAIGLSIESSPQNINARSWIPGCLFRYMFETAESIGWKLSFGLCENFTEEWFHLCQSFIFNFARPSSQALLRHRKKTKTGGPNRQNMEDEAFIQSYCFAIVAQRPGLHQEWHCPIECDQSRPLFCTRRESVACFPSISEDQYHRSTDRENSAQEIVTQSREIHQPSKGSGHHSWESVCPVIEIILSKHDIISGEIESSNQDSSPIIIGRKWFYLVGPRITRICLESSTFVWCWWSTLLKWKDFIPNSWADLFSPAV